MRYNEWRDTDELREFEKYVSGLETGPLNHLDNRLGRWSHDLNQLNFSWPVFTKLERHLSAYSLVLTKERLSRQRKMNNE